ncbi:MAG TPA: TetR/AcrR family transcriptional regulator C-terminal domain-containing protein [Methanocorpusculum sp.]|nr:TetR/AcrR family transcriptional regulator C-terminal domain-containing protein [Methanocorpusculum sp.]
MEKREVRSFITKRAMGNALKKLMETKPLHTITVSDITDECGYHRQTFYYHFADIEELLKWTFDKDVADFLSSNEAPNSWQDTLRLTFAFLSENKSFCLSVYYSLGRDTILKVFSDTVSTVVYSVIIDICGTTLVTPENAEFLTTMTTGGIISLVEQWLTGNLKWSSEEIVENLTYVANDILTGAKLRFSAQSEMRR